MPCSTSRENVLGCPTLLARLSREGGAVDVELDSNPSLHFPPFAARLIILPMRASKHLHLVILFSALLISVACTKRQPQSQSDAPRLTPGVRMQDVTFRSSALDREMRYRVIMPQRVSTEKTPVVYLLHGGDGSFRDWSNYSDVAQFAEKGLLLVMPQGEDSYYVNSATRPQDRYEDYIVHDLIADVESRFPVARGRSHRAIAGVSMGGFGAINLALKHPELFAFAGGISSALDVPSRPFSIKRIGQWRHHRSIFGDWQGAAQQQNDPFTLAQSADPSSAPYLYLTCGDQEGLLPSNRKFAATLEQRHFKYEFHIAPGGHNWNQWNARVPELFEAMLKQVL